MYIPSQNYVNVSKKLSREPKSKVVIDGVEYTGINYIKKHPFITHSSSKIIGDFSAKECSFSIYDRNAMLDLVGKDVAVYRGLVLENSTVEYIPQGIFKIERDSIKTNSTEKTIELTIKDKSSEFDCPYGGDDYVTYPCELGYFVNEIVTRHNMILETPNFPFHDFILEQRPNFDSETTSERQLIAQAGELGGCKVQMSRNGGVKITKPYNTNLTIGKLNYKKLPSKEKQFGPINSVVLSRKGQTNNDIAYRDEDSIQQNGLCEWKIYDNPYVDLIREDVIDDVAANIIGMTIIPFEINDTIDSYCYDINDSINVTDKQGNVFSTTVLSIKSTSRIFTNLGAPVQEENKTNYNLAGSSKNLINKLSFDVDYNKRLIQGLITETAELNDTVTEIGTRYTQSINQFQYEITQLNDKVDEANENFDERIDTLETTPAKGVQTTSVIIDNAGINVSTNTSKIASLMANNKFVIKDNANTELTYIGYDEDLGRSVSRMDNLTVTNYFTAGYHRQQKYEVNGENRTGWFYTGGA